MNVTPFTAFAVKWASFLYATCWPVSNTPPAYIFLFPRLLVYPSPKCCSNHPNELFLFQMLSPPFLYTYDVISTLLTAPLFPYKTIIGCFWLSLISKCTCKMARNAAGRASKGTPLINRWRCSIESDVEGLVWDVAFAHYGGSFNCHFLYAYALRCVYGCVNAAPFFNSSFIFPRGEGRWF